MNEQIKHKNELSRPPGFYLGGFFVFLNYVSHTDPYINQGGVMVRIIKLAGLVIFGFIAFFIVVGTIALLTGPNTSNDHQKTTQSNKIEDSQGKDAVIMKGCFYSKDLDIIKKFHNLQEIGRAEESALNDMIKSGDVVEVVSPRLEVRIIDRSKAPFFKFDTGFIEGWVHGGCVDGF